MTPTARTRQRFFRSILLGASLIVLSAANAQTISGTGATLPQKAYIKWAEVYAAQGGRPLKYEGIGSGGGVQAIRDRKADFGASDIPLKAADMAASGLRQFPTLLSAIVPVVNLPGIPANELKLDGSTLADLMSGRIKTWNDPAIIKLNPTLKAGLPKLPVTVLYRGERSGSTALLSAYLSSASPAWKAPVGEGLELKWPVGNTVKKAGVRP